MNLMNNLAERFGLNAYALGKYELAETWFRRLEKTEGESNRVLRNLGVILMARGNLAGAAEYLRREEELYGENLQRHRALADLHYASLDREEAQRRYAAALDERDAADLPESERNFMKARAAICADPARFARSRESADCFATAERSREADGDTALELFIKAGELDPTNWPAFNNAGVDELVLGIGGSATVDGGVGMAIALGFDILDAKGTPVPLGGAALELIDSVRIDRRDPRLDKVRILIACDVTNPLLGPKGAVRVFGPQKGATEATIPVLESGLSKLAGAWKRAGLADDVDHPGDGAAGGLGAALRELLKAEMRSGARTVMEYAGFASAVSDADLVITGEGMTDAQTSGGKLCSVVAEESRRANVPIALLSGALGGDVSAFLNCFDYAVSISCGQTSLEAMIRDSRRDLRFAAGNLLRAWRLGADSK